MPTLVLVFALKWNGWNAFCRSFCVTLLHLLLDKAHLLVDFLRKGTFVYPVSSGMFWTILYGLDTCKAAWVTSMGHAFFPCLNTIPRLLWFSVLFWGIWCQFSCHFCLEALRMVFFFFFPLKFILLLLWYPGDPFCVYMLVFFYFCKVFWGL